MQQQPSQIESMQCSIAKRLTRRKPDGGSRLLSRNAPVLTWALQAAGLPQPAENVSGAHFDM